MSFGAINLGSIDFSPFREPEEKGHPPSIGPQRSFCGVRALINREDAPETRACWRCGLLHEKV